MTHIKNASRYNYYVKIKIFYFLNFADGVGAFGIIEPKELVTIGDDVEFTCAASIYNYTDNLTWTDQTEVPLIKTGNCCLEQRN